MKSTGAFKPFGKLRSMIEERQIELEAARPLPPPECKDSDIDDRTLFLRAMEGVTPIDRSQLWHRTRSTAPSRLVVHDRIESEDAITLRQLRDLVAKGTGFVWYQTAEYVEGLGNRIHPDLARRLHRGEFAIQGHIDLHGLTAREAKDALDRFLEATVRNRKNAVLIVHGRGLSSPGEPVLKRLVVKRLSSNRWRRWIAAFTTAKSCDGGGGATYVLMRPGSAVRYRRHGG